jgi:GNAT superfamily N-acetyltransferase
MSSSVEIRETDPAHLERVLPLLLLAEPSERSLRWSLNNLSDAVYEMTIDDRVVAAASVRWEGDPCEIVELGVAESEQGRGLGKRFVAWIVDEARRRGKRALEVGTANSSIDNIAFYQKCGFRMDRVKKDYFWYDKRPRFEHGIRVRDLLMFRMELSSTG